MKKVSVVMATYNGEKYLREQMDSIINQTYPIHEIIIQDDCSTDGTVAIIEEYAKKNSNIKLFVNEHNLGFNENFKTAVMRATGDYVALSDQDDVWFKNKIEEQVNKIGNFSLCGSSVIRGELRETGELMDFKCSFERALFSNMYGHTFLCQTDFIQNERNWIPGIWYDWGLIISAYLNNGVTLVKNPLNLYRAHPGETSWSGAVNKNSSVYKPYIYGLKKYKALQKEENWTYIYSYIQVHTSKDFYPLVHKMTKLLLKKDLFSLFQLCCLCCKQRDKIYPTTNKSGLMGIIRGFFYPFIYSYIPGIIFRYKKFR